MRNGGRCKVGVFVLVAALLLGACGGDDGDGEEARATVPESTTTSSESTTTTSSTVPAHEFEPLLADPALTPEEQVEAAYLFSWDVYLDAVERGDPSFLHLAYADEALGTVTREVQTNVDEQRRRVGEVDLDYRVTLTSTSTAVVIDAYEDRTRLERIPGGELIPEEDDGVAVVQIELELVDNAWLVTRLIGYAG